MQVVPICESPWSVLDEPDSLPLPRKVRKYSYHFAEAPFLAEKALLNIHIFIPLAVESFGMLIVTIQSARFQWNWKLVC